MAMANDNIELQTIPQAENYDVVDEIGEYEEVAHMNESLNPESRSKFQSKMDKERDFFTKYDMNITHRKRDKKKKEKKNVHKSNLMDIINSELALIEIPIDKNVITTIDSSRESSNLYLKTGGLKLLRSWYSDIETGCKRGWVSIHPTFPNLDQVVDKIVPVEYVAAMDLNEYRSINKDISEKDVRFLDIHLMDIKVKQFHKISLEELLVEKLLEIFSEYKTAQNTLLKIANEVKVNRNTKISYTEELMKIQHNIEDIKFDPTLRKYMNNVILLKQDYIECFKLVTTIFNKIVTLWSDIETIRIKHNCRKSPYDINISKITINDDEYESEYNKTFEIEYSDLLDKIEHEYVTKYLEYKEQKYHNKENRLAKKNLSKPKLDINVKEIQNEVNNLVSFLVMKDRFEVNITLNKSILENAYKGKMKSNTAIKRNKFNFKIYVDDIFVCDTEQYKLSQHDCKINMLDSFSIQILPHNKTISVYLNENDTEISICLMNIIEVKSNIDIATVSIIPFEYKLQINANHKHIGCGNMIKDIAVANGVRLKSANLFNGPIRTVCHARIQVGWNQIGNQNYSQEYQTYFELSKKVKDLVNNPGNTDMLSDVIEVIYDTTLVDNKKILNALKKISKPNAASMKTDSFFVQDNTFDVDRFTLLHMRNLGEFSTLEKRMIPIQSSQISTEQLNILQKIKEKDARTQLLQTERCSETHPVHQQRHMGAKYIENLNKKSFNTFNEQLLQNSYDDVVRDFKDISIWSLFKRDVKISSSIFPNGKPWSWWEGGTVEIYVTALRAFNLPDRAAPLVPEDDNENDEEYIAGFRVKPLRPFVKINCQDVFVQTVTAVGCHPAWNQTLPLKIKDGASKDLEVNIYDEVKDDVSDAFDEGSSLHSRTVHYRYCNKWLGSVTIPIHAVFSEGKLQGTFKIVSPPVTIGYASVHQSPETQVPNLDRMIKKGISYISLQITSSRSHVVNNQKQPLPADDYETILKHINDFTTNYEVNFPMRKLCLTFISSNGQHKCVTQFLQPIPPPNQDCFPRKIRLESAMSKSSGFSKSSSTKSFDSRKNDIEHVVSPRSVERESSYSGYEGRYAKKVDDMERTINGCLRYVSLIPHYAISEPFNVTLMGLELLKTLYGSSLDHTLLLASYLLHMNIKIWVIVGLGLPRGQSSYVLVKYDKSTKQICLVDDHMHDRRQSIFGRSANEWIWCLFDASSGDRFELIDSSCPLKTVLYVFDDENIWVNIQSSLECESVSFDFSRTSEWQPVFDKNVFTMKVPPITDLHIYNDTVDVEDLKQKLEAKIKTKIQKWRSHMKTVWNRYCGTLLRECLQHWEVWSFNPTETKPTLGHRMRQLMVSYKIFGFPLNFPYTNMKSAIRRIKSTLLHDNEEPGVEFGLAVEIFSYPNCVLSVWVFLVSITRQ